MPVKLAFAQTSMPVPSITQLNINYSINDRTYRQSVRTAFSQSL